MTKRSKLKAVKVQQARKTRTTVRSLRCELTEADQRRIGLEMAQAQKEMEELEDERAGENKRLGEAIKERSGHVRSLAKTLNEGWEMRSVNCTEIFEYETGNVYLKRTDTGEVCHERAMTEDERQVSFLQEDIGEDTASGESTQTQTAAPA